MVTITPLTKKRELYRDVSLDLTRNPVTNDVSVNVNENAVKNSIRNIVLTKKGERPFDRNFGSNITSYLFENHTPATYEAAKNDIEAAINIYEPRCELIDVTVDGDPDGNNLTATIRFVVINTNETSTLEILLRRAR